MKKAKHTLKVNTALLPKGMHKHANFFENVWEVVCLIPKGRVTTYGAIGKYLGSGSSARMVGWAMNASFQCSVAVPAHRVVNRNGALTGKMHFATPTAMQAALEAEGINVINDIVQQFDEVFWDPSIALGFD